VPLKKLLERDAALLLAAGTIAVGVYFALPSGLWQAWWYVGIGVASTAALVAAGLGRWLPFETGWIFFALGLAFFVAGDAVGSIYQSTGGEIPFPSVADLFYLLGYPILAAGALVLALGRGQARDARAWLDAVAVTAGVATVIWGPLFETYSGQGSLFDKLVLFAYPVGDLVLLAALARLVVASVWNVPVLLLVAGVVLQLVGDTIYGANEATYQLGDWVDVTWLMSYVVLAAAFVDPRIVDLVGKRRERRLTWWRFGLLAASGLAALGVVVFDAATHRTTSTAQVVFDSFLVLAILSRFGDLFRSLERSRAAQHAAFVEMEQVNRLKDELITVVSHDLRTPLTSIIGYLDLLRAGDAGDLNERQLQFLDIVERNSEKLLRLVNDLLFIARVEEKRVALDLREVDVAELASHAVEAARASAQQNGIELHASVGGPARAVADRERIEDLLDNLVSNAVKFTPGGGRVDVRVARGRDGVELDVADTGIGIPRDDQQHLFERFFRSSNSGNVQGAGLGLAIVKAIVDAHGGRIAVESAEGRGTTFHVVLPAAERTEAAA
jgi:signal transduction histidine kinase